MRDLTYYTKLCNNELKLKPEPYSYFKNRAVSDLQIEKFELGYSPCNWELDTFAPFYSDFIRRFTPETPFLLADKIIMPYKNLEGETVGILIRSYKGKKFYYKFIPNTNNSHWYLYGLFQNFKSIVENREVVIVESVFDLLALEPWVPNILSLVSVRISDHQIAFLKRYVDKIILALNNDFDADSQNTGKKMSEFYKAKLKSLGFRVRMLELPNGVNDFSDLRSLNPDLGSFINSKL